MPEIVIYKAKDGHIELDVSLADDTVWLSLNQLSDLFARDKSVISRHLSNIFKTNELESEQTVAKFATVQKEGKKEVQRDMEAVMSQFLGRNLDGLKIFRKLSLKRHSDSAKLIARDRRR